MSKYEQPCEVCGADALFRSGATYRPSGPRRSRFLCTDHALEWKPFFVANRAQTIHSGTSFPRPSLWQALFDRFVTERRGLCGRSA